MILWRIAIGHASQPNAESYLLQGLVNNDMWTQVSVSREAKKCVVAVVIYLFFYFITWLSQEGSFIVRITTRVILNISPYIYDCM